MLFFVNDFLIAIDGQVVAVFRDVFLRNKKCLLGRSLNFFFPAPPFHLGQTFAKLV